MEIRKRFDEYSNSILKHYDACTEARASELGKILIILDTLEVKEEPEFTVDDIMKLDALLIKMWQSKSPNKYKEVLKQFKAQKGEEV